MTCITIHIGTPRTATTTLQSQIFPRLKEHIYIGKVPFNGAKGKAITKEELGSIKDLLKTLTGRQRVCDYLIKTLHSCIQGAPAGESLIPLLDNIISNINDRPLLISSERLCDTIASLHGLAAPSSPEMHPNGDRFPIYTLIEALESLSIKPKILVCFREYKSYLVSKYLRTYAQREFWGLSRQTLLEFIASQILLEQSAPGASVIQQTLQTDFFAKLGAAAEARAVNFKELITSENVLETLGLSDILDGPDIKFNDFPIENSLDFASAEQKQSLQDSVDGILEDFGLLSKIRSESMFTD